ncbi:immunogenic protein [Candidatus Aerophobetes bacterium]|uniref:Immunogenic protein n=1 Tax=Aerophobetes bacterium TaxID=2030807 RepID=A0A2A4YD87_UNCAE|nr:MAG: immunogenic protein [Candidatus Aerophobetes bacterium]
MKPNSKKHSKLTRSRARRMALARERRGAFARIKAGLPTFLVGLVIVAGLVGAYVLWRSPSMLQKQEADVSFFQIATGSVGGTYYPVGKAIASVISKPPGGVPCDDGGKCGVDGLIAIAKTATGSVANVRAVNSGHIESALAQADVVAWAAEGKGPFVTDGKFENLRVIASLYPEAVHLVVAKSSGIARVEDLRGKRVSIDRFGSGTQIDALLILNAYGLHKDDYIQHTIDASQATDMILSGDLDAYFLIAGTPSLAVADLAERSMINLIPIDGEPAEKLKAENTFFVSTKIAADTYKNISEVKTISVRALWITHTAVSGQVIHDVLKALWRPENEKSFLQGHAKTKLIKPQTALNGTAIPLHRGARAYYINQGLLKR